MKISNFILVLLIGLSLGACKKAPTDQQLKDVLGKAHQTLLKRDSTFEQKEAKVKDLLMEADQAFDIMKAEVRQFNVLTQWNTMPRSQVVKNWIAPRLAELSKRNDKDGAVAAYYQLVYNPAKEKGGYSPEEAAAFLKHPAVGEVFRDTTLGTVLFTRLMANMAGEQQEKAKLFESIVPYIDDQLADDQVMYSVYLFDNALAMDSLVPADVREGLRTGIVRQHERILANAKAGSDQEKVKKIEGNIAYLNSPIALGTLIGGDAPDMEFVWKSDGKTGRLSDLKGKVVVVDFWATWCGPCVASFPNIRELQKRYKGYPVEIIGVTSLQGRHVRRQGDKREVIETKDDSQKEYELMKEFMKDMDMTWNVAFSAERVFNPMYGVKGIPHVAIIDANGKVRYNGLRPYTAPCHEAEKIDNLLKEAGLKYPSKPMSTENYVK